MDEVDEELRSDIDTALRALERAHASAEGVLEPGRRAAVKDNIYHAKRHTRLVRDELR